MKATLPTNYQDDILNVSTEGKRKYRMNYNDDGTVSFIDVTPYDQEGSDYGAGDINATNEAVNQSADAGKIIDDPDTAEATTEEGYIAGVQLFNHVNDSLQQLANTEWTKIDINHTFTNVGTVYSNIGTYSELINCKEAVVVFSTRQQLCFNFSGNTVADNFYNKLTSSDEYATEYGFKLNFSTGLLEARQTIKGAQASYTTVSAIYYR